MRKTLGWIVILAGTLLLVLWFWFSLFGGLERMRRGPRPPRPDQAGERSVRPPPVDRPRTVREKEAPKKEGSTGPDGSAEVVRLDGRTKFVRRLAAGDILMREGPDISPALLKALLPAMLKVDYGAEELDSKRVADIVRFFTRPRRDRGVLSQVGEGRLIRVWTQKGVAYPRGDVQAAERWLAHILAVTGVKLPRGIDLLATPAGGAEVFPGLQGPSWAAGVYHRTDDFCALKSTLTPDFRAHVLRHECAHALCHRIKRPFSKSRMISEGLAQYLSLVEPGDRDLRLPPERLKNNLAALGRLFTALEQAGAPLDLLDPAWLLDLSPPAFYSLRGFSYLIAEATMAHVGGEVILDALRLRSDRPIRVAVKGMAWNEFRDWVARFGRGGDPGLARVVEDLDTNESLPPRRALKELGLKITRPIDPWIFNVRPTELFRVPAQVEAVRNLIGRPPATAPVVVLVDRSVEVDELLRAEFRRVFSRHRFNTKLFLVGLEKQPSPLTPEQLGETAAFDPVGFFGWLRNRRLNRAGLVICLGPNPATLRRYDRIVRNSGSRPRAVLVLDYGKSDLGVEMARGFAALYDYTGNVAYWRPE